MKNIIVFSVLIIFLLTMAGYATQPIFLPYYINKAERKGGVLVPANTFVSEAPLTGYQYARQSGVWAVVEGGGAPTGLYELDGNGDIIPRNSGTGAELFETDGNGDLEPK